MKTITHIPHSSIAIPASVRGQLVLSDAALKQELIHMTDWFTDELFGGLSGATDIVFPVSRLVVDPERFERDKSLARPEICIGTDDYHTPDELRDAAIDLFRSAGFSVAVNSPFAGALVPMEFYQSDKRALALMIEVRRDLYLDEGTAEKLPGFQKVYGEIRAAIGSLVAMS